MMTDILSKVQSLRDWLAERLTGPRIVVLGLAIILFDFLILGPFSFYQEHDNGDAIYPTVASLVDQFPSPGFFYPLGMAGTDRLALGHHGGLELFMYWLLPDWLGLTILSVLLAAIPAIFTYKIVRTSFRADPIWAGVAAVAAGMVTGHGQLFSYSIALVPPTLWYLYRIAHETPVRINAYMGLVIVTVLHGLLGHIHFLSVTIAPMAVVWLGAVFPTKRMSAILSAVFAVLFPIAMRWQDFAAAALNGPLSHRAHQTRDVLPEAGAEIWKILSRPFDLPLMALAVAATLFAVWLIRRRPSPAGPAVRLLLVCLFMHSTLLIVPIIKPFVNAMIPLFEGFQLSRVWMGTPMLWAMMIGAASTFVIKPTCVDSDAPVKEYTAPGMDRVARLGLLSITLFLVYTLAAQKIQHADAYLRSGSFTHAFASKTLEGLATRIATEGEPWRAEPIRIEATRLQSYGMETLGGYFTLYPKRYHSFWLKLIDPLRTTSPDVYKSTARLGSKSFLFSLEYDANPALADFADIDLLSLANVRYVVTKNPLQEPWLIELRRRDTAWDTQDQMGKAWENLKGNFTGFSDYYIYENPKAVRRFFHPQDVERQPDEAGVLEALSTRSLDELLATAPITEGAFPALRNASNSAINGSTMHPSIGTIRRERDAYCVKTDYAQAGILAGSVSYSPYWKAEFHPQNGTPQELKVEPIYHAFIGVIAPPGPGTVQFYYDPPYKYPWQLKAASFDCMK